MELVPTTTLIMSLEKLIILSIFHARFVWDTAFSFLCGMFGICISETPRFPTRSCLFHSYLCYLRSADIYTDTILLAIFWKPVPLTVKFNAQSLLLIKQTQFGVMNTYTIILRSLVLLLSGMLENISPSAKLNENFIFTGCSQDWRMGIL